MAKKAKAGAETSVKSYQQGIDSEKQKMGAYAKKMVSNVKSLQAEFKKHGKEMHEAGRNMIAEGNKKMAGKITRYKGEIRTQIKENNEAVSKMGSSIKFFLSEVNKTKKDFRAYQRGAFQAYINAFWG